jgi:hypothetical protein
VAVGFGEPPLLFLEFVAIAKKAFGKLNLSCRLIATQISGATSQGRSIVISRRAK